MTDPIDLEDYRWLVGSEAAGWLDLVARSRESLVRLTATLRRSLSLPRAHLVLEQVALRRRARNKFAAADRMFFTDKGLQQSTDQWVAAYKARRFAPGRRILDLCCGIGGDLSALARRGPATGVERDAVTATLAAANCRLAGGKPSEVVCRSAEEIDWSDCQAWHADPDRRSAGRRAAHPSGYAPSLEFLEQQRGPVSNAAVKLAPATAVAAPWREAAEREWIACRGECRQQVAWFGAVARHPGRRVATIVRPDGGAPRSVVERPKPEDAPVRPVGRFLFEPSAAVLAAALEDTLAAEHDLGRLAAGLAYFTGDRPLDDPALDGFEVLEQWPLDLKKIRAALRARRIGRLEIKKRGLPLDPAEVRRRLGLRGERSASLLIGPWNGRTWAVLTRRLAPGASAHAEA